MVRNTIKMFAQKKATLPPGRHKLVILDEADRSVLYLLVQVAEGSMHIEQGPAGHQEKLSPAKRLNSMFEGRAVGVSPHESVLDLKGMLQQVL